MEDSKRLHGKLLLRSLEIREQMISPIPHPFQVTSVSVPRLDVFTFRLSHATTQQSMAKQLLLD